MSVGDRILSAVKDLILVRDELSRTTETVRGLETDVRDHEVRLVRLETLVEVAGGAPSRPRLPRR